MFSFEVQVQGRKIIILFPTLASESSLKRDFPSFAGFQLIAKNFALHLGYILFEKYSRGKTVQRKNNKEFRKMLIKGRKDRRLNIKLKILNRRVKLKIWLKIFYLSDSCLFFLNNNLNKN